MKQLGFIIDVIGSIAALTAGMYLLFTAHSTKEVAIYVLLIFIASNVMRHD